MIANEELQLLLSIHSGDHGRKGRAYWYTDLCREDFDNLIGMGLITQEDEKDERYCCYEVTDKAREYVTFIKEMLYDPKEGTIQPSGSDAGKRSNENLARLVGEV